MCVHMRFFYKINMLKIIAKDYFHDFCSNEITEWEKVDRMRNREGEA